MATAYQIKTIRRRLAESQESFAKRFGVDQSTIHRWETEGPPARGPARQLIDRVITEISFTRAAAASLR